MKIGIVGTGSMGRTHAAGWMETPATIGGFVSKTTTHVQSLAKQYGAQAYPDFEAMLADVDVVDICTPTHLHYAQVLQAAAAGKHVVCEKPLARTVSQGREMIAACRDAGVKLLVAHVVRFFPEYVRAKEIVAAGDIGQPAVLRLSRGTFRPQKVTDNWFTNPEKSGGVMLDLMIHDFDYARWVAGDVVQVYAKNASVEHGLVILTHKDGALSHIEGSWAYPPPHFHTRFEIAGSDGWLAFDAEKNTAISLNVRQPQNNAPDVPAPGILLDENPYTTQIKAFYRALADDAPVPVSAADGLAALQISLAAIESARSGMPVTLPELPEVSA